MLSLNVCVKQLIYSIVRMWNSVLFVLDFFYDTAHTHMTDSCYSF
jgi:hypothetical protein